MLALVKGISRVKFLTVSGAAGIMIAFALSIIFTLIIGIFTLKHGDYRFVSDHALVMDVVSSTGATLSEASRFLAKIKAYQNLMIANLTQENRAEFLGFVKSMGMLLVFVFFGIVGFTTWLGNLYNRDEHIRGSRIVDKKYYYSAVKESIREEIISRFEGYEFFSEFLVRVFGRPVLSSLKKLFKVKAEDVEEEVQDYEKWPRRYKSINPYYVRKDSKAELGKDFWVDHDRKINLCDYILLRHLLIVGRSGSGKSLFLGRMIEDLRAKGEKAFIIDVNGDLSSKYFREGDVVLSTVDNRSAFHSLKEDGVRAGSVVKFLVPEGKDNRIWTQGPREVLKNLIEMYGLEKVWSIIEQYSPTDEGSILNFLNGPIAKGLVGKAGSGQESGIMAGVVGDLAFLEFYNYHALKRGDTKPFAPYKWAQDNSQRNIVWLTYNDTDADMNAPYMKMMTNLAMYGVLERNSDDKNNVAVKFILDEYMSIGKLDLINTALERFRKNKGQVVAAIQNIPQIEIVHGKEEARNILGCFGSMICFGQDMKGGNAKDVSDAFGEFEKISKRENKNFGTVSQQQSSGHQESIDKRQALLPSEIADLPDGHFYLKSLNLPLVKGRLRKIRRANVVGRWQDEFYSFPGATADLPVDKIMAEAEARRKAQQAESKSDDSSGSETKENADIEAVVSEDRSLETLQSLDVKASTPSDYVEVDIEDDEDDEGVLYMREYRKNHARPDDSIEKDDDKEQATADEDDTQPVAETAGEQGEPDPIADPVAYADKLDAFSESQAQDEATAADYALLEEAQEQVFMSDYYSGTRDGLGEY